MRLSTAPAFCGIAVGLLLPVVGDVAAEAGRTGAEEVLSATRAAARFAEEVKQREADYGIYDPKTGEYLLSVGLLHQSEGEHDKAAEALQRALQIQRVNNGLHDAGQLVILERLLKSNIANENWDEVDKNYHQLLWINRRNYEPGDPRLLPVIQKVGSWKLRAYRDSLLSQNSVATLKETAALFSGLVAILDEEYGDGAPLLVEALYGEALANYQLAFQILSTPVDEFQGRGSPYRSQTVCTPIVLPNGAVSQSCRVIQTPNPDFHVGKQQSKDLSVSARIGKAGRMLKRIVAIHEADPELPAAERAMALVHLGDWNLLQNRRGTALELYGRAYGLLAAAPDSEERLAKVFGQPASIPSLRLPVPEVDERLEEAGKKHYALATFDVSRSGRPRNITIIEVHPPESKAAGRKAKRSIRARRYRPRFEDGEPVLSTGNTIRIVL